MGNPVPFYSLDGLHAACYESLHANTLPGSSVDGDVEWFVARARECGGPVLEGASGTGRVAWAIARAGVEVVGFDLSPAMRARAEAKRASMPPEASAKARFVAGDLREFDLGSTFPLAIVPFRAFQALLEPAEQISSLRCFHRHLRPGGRLVMDLFDPKYEFLLPGARPPHESFEALHADRGTRVRVEIGDREVDPLRQVMREVWTFREFDSSGRQVLEERETLSLRWNFRYEMLHLIARTGFEVEAEYSDFKGSPPAYAREQVWVLRRG